MREKIITAYEVPDATEGDIYIRVPVTADKDPSTMRKDRETGEYITLWEEKIRYPYKTTRPFTIVIKTEKFNYEFPLLMDEDGTYCHNGSNVPRACWTLLGLNPGSPEGMIASLAHDNILQYKGYFYEMARGVNKDLTNWGMLFLTTDMYKCLLRNSGVGKFRAWIMGLFINLYQFFFNPEWKLLNFKK